MCFGTKAARAHGLEYEIRTKSIETSDNVSEKQSVKTTGVSSFGSQITWPVSNDSWIDTSVDFWKKTGIKAYNVHKSSSPIYDFVIEIRNTVPASYTFYDETGDYYGLGATSPGDHLVRYNSSKPTILFATGK